MNLGYSHGPHVVLRQQWDLQHLGVVVQSLLARRGHRLPGDAVDLVEGVRPEQPVVSGADEELQGERLALHVAVELGENREVVVELSRVFERSESQRDAPPTKCPFSI